MPYWKASETSSSARVLLPKPEQDSYKSSQYMDGKTIRGISTYKPPWGLPKAAKCLQVAATRAIAVELVFFLLPDWRPVIYAWPISPVKKGSSPKFSSTRPHLNSRARSRTGAKIWLIPRPSASDAMTFETDVSMLVSKDAARPIGDGKMVPMFVKPWRPVDVL